MKAKLKGYGYMPKPAPLICDRGKFVLYTNAKCGGTTLKAAFFQIVDSYYKLPFPYGLMVENPRFALQLALDPELRYRINLSNINDENLRRLTNAYRATVAAKALHEELNLYRRIIVTRHPALRAISVYLDKFCGSDRGKPWVREIVRRFGGSKGISFNQFLDYVLCSDERSHDPHWRRQTYIVDRIELNDIVDISDVERAFSKIFAPLGINFGKLFERRRQVTHTLPNCRAYLEDLVQWKDETCKHLSSNTLGKLYARTGAFPDKSRFLDEETLQKVKSAYAQDYLRFGY